MTSGPDGSVSVVGQSAGAGSLSGLGSVAAVGGVATKSVTGLLVGSVSVQASASLSGPGPTSSAALTFNVVAATAANLNLAATTTTPVAGAANNLTITAKDAFGNTAAGYTGTKSLVFSGASLAPAGTCRPCRTAPAPRHLRFLDRDHLQ